MSRRDLTALLTVGTVVVALLGLGFIGIIYGTRFWVLENEGDLRQIAAQAEAAGAEFAERNEQIDCMDAALVYAEPGGLTGSLRGSRFMESCLENAAPSPALCDGVPPRDEMVDAIWWSVERCSDIGRQGESSCTQVLATWMDYCNPSESP